jgi:hypothetical protein
MATFSGPAGVATYRAAALKSGLTLYAATGMRLNSAWTPTAMLRAAGEITGMRYRRGQYQQAAADLAMWLADNGTTG